MILSFLLLFVSASAFASGSGCDQDPVEEPSLQIQICRPNSNCQCENATKKDMGYRISPPFERKSYGYTCEGLNLLFDRFTKAAKTKNVQPHCRNCSQSDPISNLQDENDASDWLAEHVERFPRNCGYNLQVKVSVIDQMTEQIKPPDLIPKCHESMCTSATYLAFTSLLHQLKNSGKISKERFDDLIGRDKMPWKYLNELARPDRLVTDLNLGEGRVIAPDQIKDCSMKNWPKQGDFVQFWRKTGSGHSVIFEGYIYDENKKIAGFCYWSSNASTKGFAKRCEQTKVLTKMMAGRITK